MEPDPEPRENSGYAGRREHDETGERHETETERYDRNWLELLQEMRVVQTGVQILTGFLITLPFQGRFNELSTAQVWLFLAAVGLSTTATALLVAPVIAHRLMFQRHQKRVLVETGDALAKAGVVVLGLAVATVLLLVVGFAAGTPAGAVAAGSAATVFLLLWLVLPRLVLSRQGRRTPHDGGPTAGRPGE